MSHVLLCRAQLEDESYDLLKAKPPIGSICIAIILTLLGIACFVLAWLHVTQRLLGKEQAVSQAFSSRLTSLSWGSFLSLYLVPSPSLSLSQLQCLQRGSGAAHHS